MANLTITNIDNAVVGMDGCTYADDTLNLSAAATVPAGRILARDSVSSKLVNFVPGGAAYKTTNDGPFNLDPGDAFVIDVNDVGNATVTFDAAAATIVDTTTYPVADQDGLTSIVTLTGGPFDGVAQTVTFSGAHTTAAAIAASMNAQLDGCSVDVSGGQVRITHDSKGTGMDIACAAGTGGLTWAASTAGTGDVAYIDAVTATEVKTVVEADTTASVNVSGSAAILTATSELDFISGTALAKLGLSVETISAQGNGTPVAVLGYELDGASGDNAVRYISGGNVRAEKLSCADGSTVSKVIKDQLRNYGIFPVNVTELGDQDNQ